MGSQCARCERILGHIGLTTTGASDRAIGWARHGTSGRIWSQRVDCSAFSAPSLSMAYLQLSGSRSKQESSIG